MQLPMVQQALRLPSLNQSSGGYSSALTAIFQPRSPNRLADSPSHASKRDSGCEVNQINRVSTDTRQSDSWSRTPSESSDPESSDFPTGRNTPEIPMCHHIAPSQIQLENSRSGIPSEGSSSSDENDIPGNLPLSEVLPSQSKPTTNIHLGVCEKAPEDLN
ncbi:MAG: hypothetical protein M1813_009371 [Trichoglossum hirsutum]|nr:MAG: hypothetical protein M1813_009371 [Trichoglossum hirsutum]